MKPEELSIIGVIMVLFAFGCIAYAYSLPLPVYSACQSGAPSTGLPACGSPGQAADLFYGLGVSALIVGVILLVARIIMKEPRPELSQSEGTKGALEMIIF